MATELKAFLVENGFTAEEVAAMPEKQQKAFAVALGRFDEGSSALAKSAKELETARAERDEAEKFWNEKVTPALSNVDKRVATAESEKARYAAYLKTLKDQGYDVPDDLVAVPVRKDGNEPVRDPDTGKYVTPEQMGKEFRSVAPTMVSLVSLSNEYQDLFGAPYVNGDADFEEAQKARKPFRDFVREKYDFNGKRTAREAKKQEDLINQKADEKFKAREAELVARYGENADLRSPVASKFAKIEKIAERKDSWKSEAGRKAARADRLKRFENITLQ